MEEKQHHQRSSSSGSSSSFDSCSDLLHSLAPSEISVHGSESGVQTEACYKEGSISSAIVSFSNEISEGHSDVVLSLEESDPTHLEIKNDSAIAGMSMAKELVYSISPSMTFSMVRSLAENTVGKISQLQSSLRIPTGYIFSSKSTGSGDGASKSEDEFNKLEEPCDPWKGLSDEGLHLLDVNGAFSGISTPNLQMDVSSGIPQVNVLGTESSDGNKADNFVDIGEGMSQSLQIDSSSTCSQIPEHYDVMLATHSVDAPNRINMICVPHDHHQSIPCDKDLKLALGTDENLQQLEVSLKSFDLDVKPPDFTHPLGILNSGSGRPDLEEVDYDLSFLPLGDGCHLQTVSYFKNKASNCLSSISHGKDILKDHRLLSADASEILASNCTKKYLLNENFCGEEATNERWNRSEHENQSGIFKYVEDSDLSELYFDTILDMEDVLLNSDENGGGVRLAFTANNSSIGTPRSSRDGSLSSSTSGLFGSYGISTSNDFPFMIDWVEVIGAKQKRGGASFGERVVGVKDHTVYCIKVSGGGHEWEVLRRYRDFVDLYHQLKRRFNKHTEQQLPSPWKEVESDSRKVFGGTTPNVVEVRSNRIEKCLQCLLQAGPPFSDSSPLHWFLHPQGVVEGEFGYDNQVSTAMTMSCTSSDVQLGALDPQLPSPRDIGSVRDELDQERGKTIKLVLKIHLNKNLKQLLSTQRHSCAGCYKHLDVEKGLVQGFVQTLGWGKPRFCEYSGQLYCASCHVNETAVLPAEVLFHWDFLPRKVSQIAKAYLDSIYDQPMLCVSAVNPHLYSRVPILFHIKETRRKLFKTLSTMRCTFPTRIQQTMGSRKYLLENNDFFALRDLEDLSKGAFAVLPSLLNGILENLMKHITKECSICWDLGEWCGAKELCEDPFMPIFPFQEKNVTSCKVCHAVYHKTCFSKCLSCPSCPNKEIVAQDGQCDLEESSTHKKEVLSVADDKVFNSALSIKGSETEQNHRTLGQSSSNKTWPFHYLLPDKRLWKA